jgi:hypothetical protein
LNTPDEIPGYSRARLFPNFASELQPFGRAKDGESLASTVEPIFGEMIESPVQESAHQTAGGDARRARRSENQFFKSKTTFLGNLI